MKAALALALLGALLRLGAVIGLDWFRHPELFEYEVIATNLLQGHGFGLEHLGTWHRTFGSPPFSYLCALLYAIFGHSHLVIMIAQAGCSMLVTLGCYGIGRRLFSAPVGVVAAGLAAFHPGLFIYDTHKLHPLSFDAALAVGGIWLLVRFAGRWSWRSSLLTGCLHGLAVFERTTQIGLVPLTLASFWSSRRQRPFPQLAAVYALALAAVLGPWTVRNFILYRQPVLMTTTSSELFWLGNNPMAGSGAFAKGQPGVPMFQAAPEALRSRVFGQSELTQSRAFAEEASAFWRRDPLAALGLYAKKFVTFWWFSPQSGLLYPAAYLRLYQAYYAIMLGLALIGLALARNAAQRMVTAFLLSVAAVQAVFYVEIRHRWGIEPLLLIFAAAGAVALGQRLGAP